MSNTPQSVVGWDEKMNVVSHVHGQAMGYLACQQSAAHASDQRAVTFASIMIPTALALLIVALDKAIMDAALAYGAAAAAVLILVAAGLAVWSARPVDFYYAASEPWCWWESRHTSFRASLSQEVTNLQEMIEDNNQTMRTSHCWLNVAFITALAAPLVGITVWYAF